MNFYKFIPYLGRRFSGSLRWLKNLIDCAGNAIWVDKKYFFFINLNPELILLRYCEIFLFKIEENSKFMNFKEFINL